MSNISKNKIIAIVGTTGSGKTSLAVDLSLKFQGEVVSADSRQVYKYMDIGSGKDLCEYSVERDGVKTDIPYHLIDVAHPNDKYDLAKWLKGAKIAIDSIVKRKKLPIIAGGTGLYVQSLIDGYKLSEASVDQGLREKLEKLKPGDLLEKLKKINPVLADKLNNSERNNKRRLIRHIEILTNTSQLDITEKKTEQIAPYNHLVIGLTWPREDLKKRILKRIIDRLDNEDMLGEVERLHSEHEVSWKRLESFGLEYKFLARHLQDKINYNDMIKKLHIATSQFAKRQMTWLRRWEKQGAKINWVNDSSEAEELTKRFLNK